MMFKTLFSLKSYSETVNTAQKSEVKTGRVKQLKVENFKNPDWRKPFTYSSARLKQEALYSSQLPQGPEAWPTGDPAQAMAVKVHTRPGSP